MRLKIKLSSVISISLHVGFNYQLQSLIYRLLDTPYANWLHNKGFQYEKRKFKLFTFSSILEKGKYNKIKREFIFPKNITFLISSPVDWILEQVAQNIARQNSVYLGNNKLSIDTIEILPPPIVFDKNYLVVKAMTPVEVHHTEKGQKFCRYIDVFDDKFKKLINNNLKKKWEALYQKECPYNIEIEPQNTMLKRSVYYKTTKIIGWKGIFILKGESDFLKFAYNTGIGNRNSQGCGMLEVI